MTPPLQRPSPATAPHSFAPVRTPLEAGDPHLDSRAFRRGLGQFATGVTVVTACHEGQPIGMAVNSFAAVSLQPPLVLWSIRRESQHLAAFVAAGHYAVSVLAEDQVEISQMFGSGHPERFQQTHWFKGQHTGAPLIEGAIAHFECRLVEAHEGGDHLILLGEVLHWARYEGSPLLFSQGRYAITEEHPSLVEQRTQSAAPQRIDAELLRQMVHASHKLSLDFEARRQTLGVTMPMSRSLNRLAQQAATLHELSKATFLERDEITDAIASLMLLGLVDRQHNGAFSITAAGRERHAQLAHHSAHYMQEKLARISEADLAAFKRVLNLLNQTSPNASPPTTPTNPAARSGPK